MRSNSIRRRRHPRGQSLVEFALVVPIMLLLLSGILDFGFMLYSRMTVINAAREGARSALNVHAQTAAEFATIPTVTAARVATVVAGTGLVTADLTTTTTCTKSSPPCDFSAANFGTTQATAGDFVAVTLVYTYRSFFPLLFGNTIPMTSEVVMVLQTFN